jgi:plasmid stability protein
MVSYRNLLENDMPTITVKNIPAEIYERLKQSVKSNHRSINSEIITCIERAVQSHPVNTDNLLAQARQLRQITASHLLSDDEFNQAKKSGTL